MQDKLIGYLLGALEVEEATQIEKVLEADVQAWVQFEVFRWGLAPLAGDREDVDAPTGLAMRTCRRIRELRQIRGRVPGSD